MCKLLLKGRARVYPTNEDGRQAVWFAARDGYSAVTLALLEGGGNAAQADVDGLTPALAAALYGHADTIMKILRWQVRSPKLTVAFSQSSCTFMTYRVGGAGHRTARAGRG